MGKLPRILLCDQPLNNLPLTPSHPISQADKVQAGNDGITRARFFRLGLCGENVGEAGKIYSAMKQKCK